MRELTVPKRSACLFLGLLFLLPKSGEAQAPRTTGLSIAPIVGFGGKGEGWSDLSDGPQLYLGFHADRAFTRHSLIDLTLAGWMIPQVCTPGLSVSDVVCEDLGWIADLSYLRVYPGDRLSPFVGVGVGSGKVESWSTMFEVRGGIYFRVFSGLVMRSGIRLAYAPGIHENLILGVFFAPGRS